MSKIKVKTSIYARVVGYYRSVNEWNASKKTEFGQRMLVSFKNSILNK